MVGNDIMKNIEIYTDGACSGNPGPGGWGAILIYNGIKKEISGYEGHTTNNRMELLGAIKALSALKESCNVKLHTDSSYVCMAFKQNWIANWQRNGWKTASKQPVENRDLWEILIGLTKKHTVEFVKVKGHSDNAMNNRCDELARNAITNNRGLNS